MSEQTDDRVHEATPHRRQRAREQGHVATSQDLNAAVTLLVGLLIVMLLGKAVVEFSAELFRQQLGGQAWLSIDQSSLVYQWNHLMAQLARVLLPILLVLLSTAVAVNLAQVGFLIVPQRVAPDLSRINPLNGLRRIWSLTAVMRLSFGMFKVLAVGTVGVLSVHARWNDILQTAAMDTPRLARFIVEVTLWTGLKMAVALVVLAVVDYAYQRWRFEQDLRMTTEEMREEMKSLQGDPQILARRRAVQRQLVLGRLNDVVAKADVVLVDDAALAVAVQYDRLKRTAPIVLAKGMGTIAERIRHLALKHNVPIVENNPLARSLRQEVAVNQSIPDKDHAAVVEVLAYAAQLPVLSTPPGADRAA